MAVGEKGKLQRRVHGAVLVGGFSRRMGRDKAALQIDGETLVRRACRILSSAVERVAIVGENAADLLRGDAVGLGAVALQDVAGAKGPLAGIIAALEFDAEADWVVVGCDMPAFDESGVGWLIARHFGAVRRQAETERQRDEETEEAGHDATLGALPGRDRPEPVLAIYSGSAAIGLRGAVAAGETAVHRAIERLVANVIPVPTELAGQWRNVNTPEEWEAFLRERHSR